MKQLFPKYQTAIGKIYNNISYNDYNEENSLRELLQFLTEINLSIETLNKYVYPAIDMTILYLIDYKRYKEFHSDDFKSKYYNLCLEKKELRQGYYNTIKQYYAYAPKIMNEINVQVEEVFIQDIDKLFGIHLGNSASKKDINAIYQTNREKINQDINEKSISPVLFEQFFDEDTVSQSLMYFKEELDELMNRLELWIEKGTQRNPNAYTSAEIKTNKLWKQFNIL